MCCTTPVTQDTKADLIELKNLLKAAVTELEEAETPKRAATFGSVDTLIVDMDTVVPGKAAR